METNINKLDEDLLSFLAESREILEDIEPRLVGLGNLLENNLIPDDETVNHLFRGFHTIKGTASFYQLDQVVSVAHKAETLLEFFRSGRESINASCTDVLCQVCDALELLFIGLESGEQSESTDEEVRSIIYRLNGRIDLFRKKLEEDESIHDDQEIISDDFNQSISGTDDDSHRKSGKHIRIFAAESRSMMERLWGLYFMRPNKTVQDIFQDDVNQANEWLTMVSDGASFLGVDEYIPQVDRALLLLKQLNEGGSQGAETLDQFKSQCMEITAILEDLENKGPEIYTAMAERIKKHPADDMAKNTTYYRSGDMDSLFYAEAFGLIGDIEKKLTDLVGDPYNRKIQGEILGIFHKLKGSAGMMNKTDLEFLSMKSEEIMEEVLDDMVILDAWDLKALFHITDTLKTCLSDLERGKSGIIPDKAALVYILEQIRQGTDIREKDAGIILPEIKIESKVERTQEDADSVMKQAEDEQETHSFNLDGNINDGIERKSFHSEEKKTGVEPKRKTSLSTRMIEKKTGERRDIRVNTEKLDELINLVGELVIAENMVINNPDIQGLGLDNFEKASSHLRKIVRDIQDVALAVRMVPISGVFRKMIRLVHDLSLKSDKKVSLKLIGEDTEIDKTVGELISDPLVHLIRNAIDHGIERKKDRTGKGEDGQIILEASHEGGEMMIILRDNGKGLDRDRIFKKAVEMGIVSPEMQSMSDEEINDLIFYPGFSTCDDVTDFSGRGVGLDVVKSNLDKIKGRINVFSRKGRGTVFVMRIPLTLAIIEGMLIRVGKACYTIPLLSIRESVQINHSQVTLTMDGQEVVNLRGELIPVIRLHRLYHIESDTTDLEKGLIVVIEHRNEAAGLFIDEILGEQQTVIKGLSNYIDNVPGISGCTILGDGEVSLILDVGGLIKKAQNDDEQVITV